MRGFHPIAAHCRECDRNTQHDVEWGLDWDSHRDAGWELHVVERYELVRCRGCRTLGFRKAEYQIEGRPEEDQLVGVALFPPELQIIQELRGRRSGQMFEAAQLVKDSFPPAAAGLLRMCAEALIEEIASSRMDEEAFNTWLFVTGSRRKRKLSQRIGELAAAEHIGQRTKLAFDLLKHFGNDAVHDLNSIISDDQSKDVYELIELVKLVVEDSIRVPQMLVRLEQKVDANKINGDKARDVGLHRKGSGQEDGT